MVIVMKLTEPECSRVQYGNHWVRLIINQQLLYLTQ